MVGRAYRYFRGEPLFRFGYGLSYTTFAYTTLELGADTIVAGDSLEVRVDVKNTGEFGGDEVVQLYLSDVAASVPVPLRQLVGFRRVSLTPGQTETVFFTVTPQQMGLVDDDGRRVIEPGAFQVSVGGRQPSAADFVGKSSQIVVGSFEVAGRVTPIDQVS